MITHGQDDWYLMAYYHRYAVRVRDTYGVLEGYRVHKGQNPPRPPYIEEGVFFYEHIDGREEKVVRREREVEA